MNDVKPFSPHEAKNAKASLLPPEVIQAVNELLAKNYSDSGFVRLLQQEVLEHILLKMPHLTEDDIFDRKYLDFEEAFRKVGWSVEYDSPGYNESYKPSWVFQVKK